MSNTPTEQLSTVGVSIWLDDLSKDRLTTGSLKSLMDTHNVVGVTSNPTIFASAVTGSDSYRQGITEMASAGVSAEEAVFEIMISDVQGACDLLRGVFDETSGLDGRVSLEVSPLLAHDTAGTIAQAKELWARVDRPNLMIKIPATLAGLPAITEVLAAGISVNVTLIFSLARYSEVIDAYFAGVQKALGAGLDISRFALSRHSLSPELTAPLILSSTRWGLQRRRRCAHRRRSLTPGWPTSSGTSVTPAMKPKHLRAVACTLSDHCGPLPGSRTQACRMHIT